MNLEKGKSIDTNKNFIDYNILSKKAGAEEISAKKLKMLHITGMNHITSTDYHMHVVETASSLLGGGV